MNTIKKIIAALALTTLPMQAALAQDTTTDQEFPVGETVEPQVGQPYVTQTIDDWSIRCVKSEGAEDPCHLYQLVKDDQGFPVSEVAIFKLPDGGQAVAGATIITPLGTLLTQMLVLSVDGGAPKRYPFQWCTEVGCFARLGFTADELASLKSGTRVAVTINSIQVPGQPITVMMSLNGFTSAYEQIKPQ